MAVTRQQSNEKTVTCRQSASELESDTSLLMAFIAANFTIRFKQLVSPRRAAQEARVVTTVER